MSNVNHVVMDVLMRLAYQQSEKKVEKHVGPRDGDGIITDGDRTNGFI